MDQYIIYCIIFPKQCFASALALNKEEGDELKYSDLANASLEAFQAGIERIINKTLRSVWDENAIGWHEQWDNVDLAGIYASCEGIVLLSKYGHKDITSDLIERVYELNLCRAFDKDYVINEDSKYVLPQKRQRDKALNVSYKLSKFLLATKHIDLNKRNNRITSDVVNRLCSLFDFDKLQFRIAVSSDYTSVLSTVTAFVAIKDFIDIDNPIMSSTINTFTKTLSLELSGSNIDSMILTLWAVSESLDSFDNITLQKAIRLIKKIIKYGKIPDNSIMTVKFPIPMLGLRDSYSINTHLIFLSSVINFIRSGWLEHGYVKFLVPDMQRIITIVQINKAYGQDVEPFTVMFWENYYALLLLNNFYKLIFTTELKEESFMIVAPKLFSDQDFSIQDDLAVVIMPFKADWSDDMYDIFKEAVANFSGTTFSTWRSDEEYTDDVIIQTVWKKINQAKFIIADCTGRNPNVFYELGIAHTLGKPVFMCSQDMNDFPFDIKHIRSYLYGLKPGEIKKLKAEISNFMSSI